MSVARYPFLLTVHLKNGSQLFLDRAVHLNGEWEMCIKIKAVTSCSTHKIDQQETDG